MDALDELAAGGGEVGGSDETIGDGGGAEGGGKRVKARECSVDAPGAGQGRKRGSRGGAEEAKNEAEAVATEATAEEAVSEDGGEGRGEKGKGEWVSRGDAE